MDTDDARIYQGDNYHEPLTPYEPDITTDYELRRTRRMKQVNFAAIFALKSYREQLPRIKICKDVMQRISLIEEMPIEIISEILGYLHPIDLLNLSKINSAVSNLMKDKSFTIVWKTAFANYPDIPDIPQDVSALRWADLLFNPHICEECGDGSARPNITFYRRLCHECNEKEFEIEPEVEQEGDELTSNFSDDPLDAHNLARRAKAIFCDPCNSFATAITSCTMYNKAELDYIRATLLRMTTAINNKVPGAEDALKRYRTERNAIIAKTNLNNANGCRWVAHHDESKMHWASHHVDRLYNNIKVRFKRLGVFPRDVDYAYFDLNNEILFPLVIINGITRLTQKRWSRLRPILEPAIDTAREKRLQYERDELIRRRTEFAREQCRHHQKGWLPATWAYHPPFYAIQRFESIRKVIHAPHDSDLVEDDMTEVLRLLPQEVEDWHASKMRELVSLIPDAQPNASAAGNPPPESNVLGLATSVFRCLGSVQTSLRVGGCLIGWDDAGPHLRCRSLESHWGKRLHFSQRGRDAAMSLVRLVGLDPVTTTKWEMNSLDKRFVCMNCPLVHGHARLVYEWAEAVYHGMLTENDEIHMSFSWNLLGPEADADFKCREDPDPYIWEENWICNHCPIHFEDRVTRRDAISHVQESHDISRPVNNLDYLYFSGHRTQRPPVRLPVDPRVIACLRCASTKPRLYRERSIKSHLRNAHGIVAPVAEDWKKISIFARPINPDPVSLSVNDSDDQIMVPGLPD